MYNNSSVPTTKVIALLEFRQTHQPFAGCSLPFYQYFPTVTVWFVPSYCYRTYSMYSSRRYMRLNSLNYTHVAASCWAGLLTRVRPMQYLTLLFRHIPCRYDISSSDQLLPWNIRSCIDDP